MTYASPANERWYVAARSGRQTALLLGPYPDHAAAAVHVERGRALTREQFGHDMKATFATFGVARVVSESAPAPRFTDTAGPGSDRPGQEQS